MDKKRILPVLVVILGVCVLMAAMPSAAAAAGGPPWKTATPTPIPPTPPPAGSHIDLIDVYEGPATCVACHSSEAESILNSEHMQWAGKWKEVNTYCTAPEPADFACRSCHVSTGKVAGNTVNDTDCLICHNDVYKRALGPQENVVTVVDWTGAAKTYYFPIKVNGDYQFQPWYAAMPAGTTLLSLAQNVSTPTRLTCLNCHAKAGGGDGVKRGDLFMENVASTDAALDVHMDADGANLACQDCHVPLNHLIPGKGVDLRVSEGGTVTCQQCHEAEPHADVRLNTHARRVACQTCHIPRYGKAAVGTELSRDWTHPHWNPSGCNGQGAWIGEEVKGYDVIPSYEFWNGESDTYDFGETIYPEDGGYSLAEALGTIQDGVLYPLKVHTSYQPLHVASRRMVQYDVLWQFMTGLYAEAAARGVDFMGLNGMYKWVEASADQLITHGVEPKENALQCAACHDSDEQMDLQALGYVLKDSKSVVCAQCHRVKPYHGQFVVFHTRHVVVRGKDCSYCHAFSRPERGLEFDPTP